MFAPPSARRNFFKCAPLTWNTGSAPGYMWGYALQPVCFMSTDDHVDRTCAWSVLCIDYSVYSWFVLIILLRCSLLVYRMLPVSLDCKFLIAPSVLPNVYWGMYYNLLLMTEANTHTIYYMCCPCRSAKSESIYESITTEHSIRVLVEHNVKLRWLIVLSTICIFDCPFSVL